MRTKKVRMKKNIRLTAAEKEVVKQLRLSGETYIEIAKKLGKTMIQIAWFCQRNNIHPKEDYRCYVWNNKRDAELLKAYNVCKTLDEVSKMLGIKKSIIGTRATYLRRNGVFIPYLNVGRPTRVASSEHRTVPESIIE